MYLKHLVDILPSPHKLTLFVNSKKTHQSFEFNDSENNWQEGHQN